MKDTQLVKESAYELIRYFSIQNPNRNGKIGKIYLNPTFYKFSKVSRRF